MQERLQHVPTQAARGSNETFAVLLEQFPVETRLVVIPLEKRQAR